MSLPMIKPKVTGVWFSLRFFWRLFLHEIRDWRSQISHLFLIHYESAPPQSRKIQNARTNRVNLNLQKYLHFSVCIYWIVFCERVSIQNVQQWKKTTFYSNSDHCKLSRLFNNKSGPIVIMFLLLCISRNLGIAGF